MEEKLKERLMREFHFQDAVGFGVCVEGDEVFRRGKIYPIISFDYGVEYFEPISQKRILCNSYVEHDVDTVTTDMCNLGSTEYSCVVFVEL